MFQLPTSIQKIEQLKNYGKFQIEGLYPGYGITLGNSLRRVLISSIEGAAVTSLKIEGIQHEFSPIENVMESALDIMLNLKQLRVKLYTNEPQVLKLDVEGEKEITAKDFKKNTQAEILNPDLHIATLTDKKAKLNLEVTVEKGLGYVLAEDRRKEKLPIGTIALDAIFSPVQKTNFKVENMRVGDRTDYNRLIIEIETDGSITPEEALGKAASILQEHFNLIAEKFAPKTEETKITASSAFKREKKEPKDVLIEELELSARTKKALINNGIKTLAGLLRYKEDKLSTLEGLGEKSLEEVKQVLKNLEYTLK
ncbi:MAG: DNA-directed RNA polymerase subunit alpha [Parcubacteria group bacterium]|nr:DNA-directed RNA polymerase subunit alpha [Parcubacteria group bacterium]